MCGRFVQFSSLRILEKYFNIQTAPDNIVPSYNIAPTQQVLAIVKSDDYQLQKFYWGLVPSWAQNLSGASRLINARVETLATKPSFRAAFKRRRCLILADGFYEWKGEKGHKQPWFIALPSDQPLAFAGLWEIWKDRQAPPDQSDYRSCTIITTEASESLRDIHHRMPVILKPEAHEKWLDPQNQDVHQIESILQTNIVREFKRYPVSKRINRIQNNSADNIEPQED
ncbi:MAG: SOS response-associated peptidase [Desulfobacterales bacterium]|nr:MAG: SOS response-associated peptidase [Desulfobacterales bacterium]